MELFNLKGGRRSRKSSRGRVVGSRAKVYNGTADITSGGLRKSDLMQNKRGRIVSRRARTAALRTQNLKKAGITVKKGVFGAFRNGKNLAKSRKSRKSRRSNRSRKSRK